MEGQAETLTDGQVAFAARALASAELDVARRVRPLLSDSQAVALVEALEANQAAALAALEAASTSFEAGLAPSPTSSQLEALAAAGRAWLDTQGLGVDAAFLARQVQDLGFLLRVLDDVLVPNASDSELLAALERLRDAIAAFRDAAHGLAPYEQTLPGGLTPDVSPDNEAAPGQPVAQPQGYDTTSWGPGPSRATWLTGTNLGEAAYEKK